MAWAWLSMLEALSVIPNTTETCAWWNTSVGSEAQSHLPLLAVWARDCLKRNMGLGLRVFMLSILIICLTLG